MLSDVIRVFVSSTWEDLEPERNAVESALQKIQETKFRGMEYFGSRNDDTRRASLKEVDSCRLYIGIFGARYGSGITEEEYRRARDLGLECLIYFKKDDITLPKGREIDEEKVAKLQELKKDLLKNHTVTKFDNPNELATDIVIGLTQLNLSTRNN